MKSSQLAFLEETEENIPDPGSLVEGLRSYGYSLSSAISDLIDNSITAKSKNIWIDFEWNAVSPTIMISDDGVGMTNPQLVQAMKIGSQNPLDLRQKDDLGRFGLGMKTASFSQCRKLTVFSKAENTTNGRTWDLDEFQKSNKWIMRIPDISNVPEKFLKRIENKKSGTVVLWEQLDEILSSNENHEIITKQFYELIEKLRDHIATYFHVFLSGKNLNIHIQDTPVQAWDPFLEGLSDIIVNENLPNGITVVGYVLPHKDSIDKQLSDKRESARGIKGWQEQQGFYVYRENRLIVNGEWFDGVTKELHQVLARIRLNIPNELDKEWSVDVMKSTVQPKGEVKELLKPIARKVRAKAVEVHRYRATGPIRKRKKTENTDIWMSSFNSKNIKTYKINKKHPLIKYFLNNTKKFKVDTKALFKTLEEYLPVGDIGTNIAEAVDLGRGAYKDSGKQEKLDAIKGPYKYFRENGMDHHDALNGVKKIEPGLSFPEIVDGIEEEDIYGS